MSCGHPGVFCRDGPSHNIWLHELPEEGETFFRQFQFSKHQKEEKLVLRI